MTSPHQDAADLVAELRSPIWNEETMKQWDSWRAMISDLPGASLPRDCFESFLDEIDERRAEVATFIEQQAKALSEAEAEREYICRSHSRLAADFQDQADKFDAEIAVKEARLAEAMKVIEPFALIAEHDIGSDETDLDTYQPMTYNTVPRISVGHLRAARSFLNLASNKEG